MRLSKLHKRLLLAIAGQAFLKAHCDIEGNKIYILHLLDGGEEIIPPVAVAYRVDHGLIDSNKKFPATTYWLTDLGAGLAKDL